MAPNRTRAEFYRREAARLHRLAEVATLPEVRVNLVRTAHLYEAMARRAMAGTGAAGTPSPSEAERTPMAAAQTATGSRTPERS